MNTTVDGLPGVDVGPRLEFERNGALGGDLNGFAPELQLGIFSFPKKGPVAHRAK